ncbi:FtsX-like permease family protein [Stackebrandtia albiflava]|uniref:FtsX-like permease family protein n=1 Tax=Stackebrandtia albiflava TaxID=406432 RepID=A0A562VCL3_9ACTN|nr:ABC transporter permease [Stackebrandtia albiflava]TWJ15619.1 FtsX-like permease family protein [Stackebrandtia albiflava]
MTRGNPTGMRRWAIDFATGLRLASAGGAGGLVRTTLTAVAVGLAVGLLLVAASLPHIFVEREARAQAVDVPFPTEGLEAGPHTVLVQQRDTRFGEITIIGHLVKAEGDTPAVPAGLERLPGPGELMVSPALAELLETSEGSLLAPRLDGEPDGLISQDGLVGPGDYRYYLGSDALDLENSHRVAQFGVEEPGEPFPMMLVLLALISFTVLLLPVAMFMGVAARFGGDSRDRRLAALRLLGTDRAMTRRVAAGEALLGAFAGLVAGTVFFLIGRRFVEGIVLWDVSVFVSDVVPDPVLTLLIVVAVPVITVGVSWLAMRRLIIEPLGVFRQAAVGRRRLWWRLLLPVAGLASLVLFARDGAFTGGNLEQVGVAAGVMLVLIGAATLLPWVLDAVVHRIEGGPVPWQLAIRRLQLGGDAAARAVSGIAVAAAGAVALQMLFFGVQGQYVTDTGVTDGHSEAVLQSYTADVDPDAVVRAVDEIDGAETSHRFWSLVAYWDIEGEEWPTAFPAMVGECADLAALADVTGCADGDAFFTDPGGYPAPPESTTLTWGDPALSEGLEWTVPADLRQVEARYDPINGQFGGLLLTPGAVEPEALATGYAQLQVLVSDDRPLAIEHIRNLVEPTGSWQPVTVIGNEVSEPKFDGIRRGLLIGVTGVMTLVGFSLLIGMLEQLQERRRLLSVLSAFGTRRRVLGWSVLWQVALPVAFGLVLSLATGTVVGGALLTMVDLPFAVDWWNLAMVAGIGAGVVLLVTVISLPVLWRLMRADGIRTE